MSHGALMRIMVAATPYACVRWTRSRRRSVFKVIICPLKVTPPGFNLEEVHRTVLKSVLTGPRQGHTRGGHSGRKCQYHHVVVSMVAASVVMMVAMHRSLSLPFLACGATVQPTVVPVATSLAVPTMR